MSKIYLAVTVTVDPVCFVTGETMWKGERYSSFVVPVSEMDNIVSRLAMIGGLKYANAYTTKKRAEEIVRYWNECHKKNGTYAY